MSTVRTNAAAEMLGVSPNTLRSWERRFGFPAPRRTQGGHRLYELSEVEALRQAFSETHNISSAISVARQRGEGPSSAARMEEAYRRFESDRADRLLEESLAVRSVERTIEEVLLPAVEALEEGSAERQTGWRHATGWLAAAARLAPPAHRPEGVLLLDGSTPFCPESLYAQALEFALRRSGLRVLTLAVELDPARMGRAMRALTPSAIVLAGRDAPLDRIGRLVHAARQAGPEAEVLDFRGCLPNTGASTVFRLGDMPLAARDLVLERLEQPARVGSPVHVAPAGRSATVAS